MLVVTEHPCKCHTALVKCYQFSNCLLVKEIRNENEKWTLFPEVNPAFTEKKNQQRSVYKNKTGASDVLNSPDEMKTRNCRIDAEQAREELFLI